MTTHNEENFKNKNLKPLTVKEVLELKAKAVHLNPVVTIGNNMITEAVLKEIKINLVAHELIKVKFLLNDRKLREDLIQEIITTCDCYFIQHIGKIAIFYKTKIKS